MLALVCLLAFIQVGDTYLVEVIGLGRGKNCSPPVLPQRWARDEATTNDDYHLGILALHRMLAPCHLQDDVVYDFAHLTHHNLAQGFNSGFTTLIARITFAVNHLVQLALGLRQTYQAGSAVASSPQRLLALQVRHRFDTAR